MFRSCSHNDLKIQKENERKHPTEIEEAVQNLANVATTSVHNVIEFVLENSRGLCDSSIDDLISTRIQVLWNQIGDDLSRVSRDLRPNHQPLAIQLLNRKLLDFSNLRWLEDNRITSSDSTHKSDQAELIRIVPSSDDEDDTQRFLQRQCEPKDLEE